MRPSGLFGGTKNHTMSMLLESWVNCFIGDGKYAIDPSPIDTTARACMHPLSQLRSKYTSYTMEAQGLKCLMNI